MSVAALLIAHGSRRAEANADLFRLAELLRDGAFSPVVASFLEVAAPDIPSGAAECVEAGATEVRMLPYFLSMGRHVAEDLAAHQAELSARHPGVRFRLCPPLGLHPLVIDVIRHRLDEVSDT